MACPTSEGTMVHMAPSQERLDKIPSSEVQPENDETVRTVRIREERQTTPNSPRRNGIPPKRPLATARRTAGATPSPANMSTASPVSRATPGSSLSKPPTRPTTTSTARRPPTSVTAATAASSRHRLRASMTSFDDDNKPGASSADENKKQVIGRLPNKNPKAGPTTTRSPAIKSLPSSTDRRSNMGTAASIERQNGARAGSISPTKSALRPTTNNARSSTVGTSARSVRPAPTSSRGTTSTASSGLAKKRLSTIAASPAHAKSNVVASDSESAAPTAARKPMRPGLVTRMSTMSVTIEQRLREMEAVSQMLTAAMAEDGDESDEVKEEYGKKADESLASLRLKLEEARQKEAEKGTDSAPISDIISKRVEADIDRSATEKTPSHNQITERSGTDARQLQMALAKSQEKVQVLEAELEALQTKMLEYVATAADVSKDVQEATENIRREHALKIEEIMTSHTHELDTLRAILDEEKANTDTLSALKADLATERANRADTVGRLERALSNIRTLEGRLEERRHTSEEAIKEKDQALEVKDRDILTLQGELQELQDTQSRELDALKFTLLRSSSALEAEVAALRAKLVEAEDNSLLASTRHDESVQGKDREMKGMHQVIENLQDELQQLRESKERELDSHSISLVQEHESILTSLRAKHQAALDVAQQQSVEAAQSTHLAHEQEIQELLREHDHAQGELQNSLAEMVASKTNLEADVYSTKARHANELNDYQARLDKSEQLLNEAKAAQQETPKAVGQLQEQISALELERDETKTAQMEIQNDLEKASGEVASLRKVLETFDDESKNKDEQHASALKKLKDEAANILDQTNAESSSTMKRHTSALQTLRDSHAKEIKELNAASDQNHDDAMQALQSQHDRLQTTLQETEKRHTAALEKVKTEHLEALGKLKAKHCEALEKHAQILDGVKVTHSKELEELKIALERKHDSAIQELGTQQTKLQESLKKEKEQHAATLEKVKAEHAEALRKLKAEHSKALEKHTQILNGVKMTHTEELEEVKIASERELDSTIQQLKSQQIKLQENLKQEKEQHFAALEKLETEHTKTLKMQSETLDEEKKARSKEVEELKVRLEREYAQSKQEWEAKSADKASEAEKKHLQDVEALRVEHEQKYAAQRKELEDGRTRSTFELHTLHEAALSELQLEIEQQKEAVAQAKRELQAAQDNTKDSQDHEALLAELKVELEQAANVKRELESTLQHITKERDDVVPAVEELENLKRDLPAAKAEAEQHRDAVKTANLKIKELNEKLAAAGAEVEEHKANHQQTSAELSTLQSDVAKANAASSEVIEAEASRNKQDLKALQKAADAEREQSAKLKALLRKAEETAEQHTIRIREVEAALKVTTAELTEMQTKRADGSDFVASPTSKGHLRLSRWRAGSPTKDGEKEASTEGEELGPHIEGTMAGLQEQVRQLEDVNEDMLEETARIVSMLSKITEPNALENVQLSGTSPPPVPVEEVVEG